MKKINLLPMRESEKNLKIRSYVTPLSYISSIYVILLFIAKIITIQQIKHYQLDNEDILFQIKKISTKVQEVKKLKYEQSELKNIAKVIHINHQEIEKILDLIDHFKHSIPPALFVRLIEFYPPYLTLIMHANSKKEYIKFKKWLELNSHCKIKWLILNQSQNLQLDFMANILLQRINKRE